MWHWAASLPHMASVKTLEPRHNLTMPHSVCPWWLGYLLASPLRRLQYEPANILAPYVREGMTVLEYGPGMGSLR
jgi:hypothetical protein